MEITLPYHYNPRPYQLSILQSFDSGKKRLVGVWHRRAGKEKTGLNIVIKSMMQRVGIYYYFFPTYAQGRKILWEGIDKDGFKFLSHFPPEILDGKPNDTEMKIKTINGSLFRVIGTDNINDIVGTNPVGCVFTEYAIQNPQAWEFIRPILRENGGWAIFFYTPRGFNHGKTLYDMAQNNDDWFCQLLTVKDTQAIPESDIELERQSGMDEDLIQQEFYCSFEGAMQGSYYTNQLKEARKENRICNIPYEKEIPVDTFWDLGVGDYMTIWFMQAVGKEYRFIDYMEVEGEGLIYCISELKKRGYIYGEHYAPHDIKVRELSSGKSRLEVARGLGINFNAVQLTGVDEGIDAVRRVFNRCWFDEKKCKLGLDALASYHKVYDEKRKIFNNTPYHDWSSHGSDSLRTFAMGYKGGYFNESESQVIFQSRRGGY